MACPTSSVAGLGSNLKIQLIGHCVICLKRTKREYENGGRIIRVKNNDGEEYAPRAIITAPGFLETFNLIWDFIQKKHNEEINGGDGESRYKSPEGISLQTVLTKMEEDGSDNINAILTDALPTICLQCCEKVVAVQDMMKVLRYQIQEIEVLVKESRGIQVYTMEVENYARKKKAEDKGGGSKDKLENETSATEEKSAEGSGVDETFGDDDDSYYGFNMQLNPETGEWEDPPKPPSTGNGKKKVPKPSSSKSASLSSDQSEQGDNFAHGVDEDRMSDDQQEDHTTKSNSSKNGGGSGNNNGNDDPNKKPQRPAILRGKRIKWQELKISDEELERDWRRRCLYKQNYGVYQDYYCAYGKHCQRKIKKKILTNGVSIITTNGLEHSNHRRIHFGLTDEQKEFIVKCVKEGVTQPNNILLSFYAQNVKAPEKLQLCNWLARNKRMRTFENL